MPPVHHHVFHCFSPSIKESIWQKVPYLTIEAMVLFFSQKTITNLKQMVNEGQIVFNPPPTCNIIEIVKAIPDIYKKPFVACILCIIYAAGSWGMVLFGF